MKSKALIIVSLILAVLLASPVYNSVLAVSPAAETQAAILYVKPGAAGDCTSWEQACELQDALGIAVPADQVWVAAGTYKPTTTNERTISFVLKTGVALYGGFPANGGDWDLRDWQSNLTTLSGDIGVTGEAADNSYHVVLGSSVDASAVLDGFTITAGNADDPDVDDAGGGLFIDQGSPTLRDIHFLDNSAVYGGGIFNIAGSPALSGVTFTENEADTGGGGMVNFNGSNPTLTDVTFSNNSAQYGGGMDNYQDSNPEIMSVTFTGNSAMNGGGMFNVQSSPTLTNVTFSGNLADYGAGMYNYNASYPELTNVTFTGNQATSQAGGVYNASSNPTLTNTILWGNTPNQIANEGSSPTVTFSDVQGGYLGEGNIDIDPLLGNLADNGGATLTHALLDNSPAIDAGSPSLCPPFDQRGHSRPVDGDQDGLAVCDMGSYEYGVALFSLRLPLVVK